jgi:hypothetical protein
VADQPALKLVIMAAAWNQFQVPRLSAGRTIRSIVKRSRLLSGHSKPTAAVPGDLLSGWQSAAVGILLVWYFVAAISAANDKSATFDEPYHLTGGYTYWKFGDFRIQPENGNLPQRLAALPLLFADCNFPSLDEPTWRASNKDAIATQFVYREGNNAAAMLRAGRVMIALLGMTLGAVVFYWTRRLLGVAAAFTSLTLYVFCPTLLTGGALATSDMAAALFFTASVACLWHVLQRLSWPALLTSSLVMGCLFVSKFSAPLIVLIGGLLVGIQIASDRPLTVVWGKKSWAIHARGRRLLAHSATAMIHALVVWAVIWTCYNFRYSMFQPALIAEGPSSGESVVLDTTDPNWDALLEKDQGWIHAILAKSRDLRLLPEAYLYGFAYVRFSAQQRPAFLNGEVRATGWPQFFPYCLLVKTPLTLFVLMALATAAIVRAWLGASDDLWPQRRARIVAGLYPAAPLLCLLVVYWGFAISSHLNIGHRHLLPTYPAMIILAGGSALWLLQATSLPAKKSALKSGGGKSPSDRGPVRWLTSRRSPGLAVATLSCVGLFAVESIAAWPNYLAYFNPLVGGQSNAYRHLVDSSLDWGQDLPALRRWLVAEGLDNEPSQVYLSYFGVADPRYHRISATWLPSVLVPPGYAPPKLDEGTYCISATMLQGVYTRFPGRWNPGYERVYQLLRGAMSEFERSSDHPPARQQLIARFGGADGWNQAVADFHGACFARLCSYLRQREPHAEINYSILIYRVTHEDLERALEGPPPESAADPFATAGALQ